MENLIEISSEVKPKRFAIHRVSEFVNRFYEL